jgi:lysophospholipase L1-like esterase
MLRSIPALTLLLLIGGPPLRAADPEWVGPMREVHKTFTGTPGTLGLFGDSITVSLAFWAPLESAPKSLDPEAAKAIETVRGHMKADCWRKWRGPEFGNQGSMTIRWADENVAKWLRKLNPEAVVLMFGTNDLGPLDEKEYGEKTRAVVERCLKNGTVVMMTTIPPRSGSPEKAKKFADVQRKVAADFKLPLIDYQAEILKRRPDDWDGTLPKFKEFAKDVYQVPTLVAADGVHPSNPKAFQDYSEKALSSNGFQLRNYLTLLAYAEVIRKVLAAK